MKRYLTALCFTGGIFWAVTAALHFDHFNHPLLTTADIFISSVLFFTVVNNWER